MRFQPHLTQKEESTSRRLLDFLVTKIYFHIVDLHGFFFFILNLSRRLDLEI